MSELGSPPVNFEKSIISSTLNSAILTIFLMGMYTIIYFGTIYIYCTRKSSNQLLVPATISILFCNSISLTGMFWYATKWEFIDKGDTRDSVFIATWSGPQWVNLLYNILSYIVFLLSDGLLIWRCIFVWNRSVRIVSLTLFLIVIEAALFMVQIIINAMYYRTTLPRTLIAPTNDLLAAAYFMSFATSLLATILTAYRIYSLSKESGSVQRFKHILDIVVQSGAVYSLTLFVIAIGNVLPGASADPTTPVHALISYTQMLAIPMAGMSTTILVARVALLAPDTTFPSTSVNLSGLQFGGRSAHQTDTLEGGELTQSNDRSSVGEGHETKGKVQ